MTYDVSQFEDYGWDKDRKVGCAMFLLDLDLTIKHFLSAGFLVKDQREELKYETTRMVYISLPSADIELKMEYAARHNGWAKGVLIRDNSQSSKWHYGSEVDSFWLDLKRQVSILQTIKKRTA
jgi:hypothetical protein